MYVVVTIHGKHEENVGDVFGLFNDRKKAETWAKNRKIPVYFVAEVKVPKYQLIK